MITREILHCKFYPLSFPKAKATSAINVLADPCIQPKAKAAISRREKLCPRSFSSIAITDPQFPSIQTANPKKLPPTETHPQTPSCSRDLVLIHISFLQAQSSSSGRSVSAVGLGGGPPKACGPPYPPQPPHCGIHVL